MDLDAILKAETDENLDSQNEAQSEATEAPAGNDLNEAAQATGETLKEETGSTPEPDVSKETAWQFEAYKDEKRKRQELERRLQEIESSKRKEPEKAPDIFEDQEAYNRHIEDKVNSRLAEEKIGFSQFVAEREFGAEVVAQKFEAFKEIFATDPSIGAKVMKAASPYHEMINVVNKAEKLKKLENVDNIEAAIRAEVEAKIRAEYEQKAQAQKQKLDSITPSLNNQASVKAGNSPNKFTLESILGR